MKKLLSVIVLFVSALLLVACGGVSMTKELEVKFSGYDGVGTLEYNEGFIDKKIQEELLKKAGFDKKAIEVILRDDAGSMSVIQSSSDNIAKYEKFESYLESLEYGFNKYGKLSNGDKVVFEIKSDDEKHPIKSEKKEFTVKGLKKSQKVTLKEVLDGKYTIQGFDGFGTIEFSDIDVTFDEKKQGKLSNGDAFSVAVNESYKNSLAQEGKILTEQKLDIEVSGLKKISEAAGLSDVFAKIPDVAKSRNLDSGSDTTYKYVLEKHNDFVKYHNENNLSFFKDSSEWKMNIVSVYKIIQTTTYGRYSGKEGTVETKEYYAVYGYANLEVIDTQIILSDLSKKQYFDYETYENLESAVSVLKTNDYIEYVSE